MTTIFHIDPDPVAQKAIQTALAPEFNVVPIASGSIALQYCAMIQPNLVLIDFALPDIGVAELAQRLKMFMPQTPILALSVPAQADATLTEGIDLTLTPPVDPQTLTMHIRALLPPPALSPPHLAALSTAEVSARFESQIAALNLANQRLASLNAVGALIGSSLDLNHLTDQVLQQLHTTIDFDSATLFLLKGNILEAAASRGLSGHGHGLNVYPKSEQNSAWQVVRHRLPLVINDVTASTYWEPRPELAQVRSWLGVPLVTKERVVGVLTLDKNQPGAFSDADARYLFTLAFQIAIAVENAQLFQEWERQATHLKLINEVNQEITTILDVGTLYHKLGQAIARRLPYDRVALLEMDSSGDFLLLRACYGRGQRYPRPGDGYRQPVRAGLIGRCVDTKRPLLVKEITGPEEALPGLEAQSALVVPLIIEVRVEAVLYVDSVQPASFADLDLWTLSNLATNAAALINNARLYHNIDAYSEILQQTIEARTRRLHAIRQISQVISQQVSQDQLLAVVGERISRIFLPETQSDQGLQVAIGLIEGGQLRVSVIFDPDPAEEWPKIVPGSYRLNYQAVMGQVIQASRPQILNNVDWPRLVDGGGVGERMVENAVMIVPLTTAGKTTGVLMVQRGQSHSFTVEDLETLESVAFQVASAVEYARLLRKTKEMAIVEERTRLARDMHDGIAQNLAYLLIQVDRCLNLTEPGSQLESRLETIGQLMEQNIDELRRNIFDLRPVELEGKLLVEVLEKLVAEFGRRWNLQTTCRSTGPIGNLSAEVQSCIYRILQESLANARQHAHCRSVTVELSAQPPGWLTLHIRDDGQGFDPAARPTAVTSGQNRGLGLISMRERAESVGGTVRIISAPGQGAHVMATLPLEAEPS
jgi:signal transduction histidine kinase/DNA-binding response OmpR family regulator